MSVSTAARRIRNPTRWLGSVASVGLMVAMFAFVLPLIASTTWSQLPTVLHHVSSFDLLLLTSVWFAGLAMHTVALTAALPSLSHRRALTLSLTGSAVSNVTPLGGAIGVGLNYHMSRTWGFSKSDFVIFTFITNLWDVLAKICVPASIVAVLLASGRLAGGLLTSTAVASMVLLTILLAVLLTVVVNEALATRAARLVERASTVVLRLVRSQRTADLSPLLELRAGSWNRIRMGWPRLTGGQLAYSGLLLALLWTSLQSTGSGLTTSQILAGFAVERLLSLSILTPGGAGVIEVGLAGFLVATGGDPVGTVAGVLLYRAFTFLMEIPVGGMLLAGWLWVQRQRRLHRRHPGDVPMVAVPWKASS